MTRIALAALLLPLAAAASDVSIRNTSGAFQVTGWKAAAEPASGWSSIFSVYAGLGDVPAMLGSYAVERATLTFRPRWPLGPGMRVRAVFHRPGDAPVEAVFETAKAAGGPATRI